MSYQQVPQHAYPPPPGYGSVYPPPGYPSAPPPPPGYEGYPPAQPPSYPPPRPPGGGYQGYFNEGPYGPPPPPPPQPYYDHHHHHHHCDNYDTGCTSFLRGCKSMSLRSRQHQGSAVYKGYREQKAEV